MCWSKWNPWAFGACSSEDTGTGGRWSSNEQETGYFEVCPLRSTIVHLKMQWDAGEQLRLGLGDWAGWSRVCSWFECTAVPRAGLLRAALMQKGRALEVSECCRRLLLGCSPSRVPTTWVPLPCPSRGEGGAGYLWQVTELWGCCLTSRFLDFSRGTSSCGLLFRRLRTQVSGWQRTEM